MAAILVLLVGTVAALKRSSPDSLGIPELNNAQLLDWLSEDSPDQLRQKAEDRVNLADTGLKDLWPEPEAPVADVPLAPQAPSVLVGDVNASVLQTVQTLAFKPTAPLAQVVPGAVQEVAPAGFGTAVPVGIAAAPLQPSVLTPLVAANKTADAPSDLSMTPALPAVSVPQFSAPPDSVPGQLAPVTAVQLATADTVKEPAIAAVPGVPELNVTPMALDNTTQSIPITAAPTNNGTVAWFGSQPTSVFQDTMEEQTQHTVRSSSALASSEEAVHRLFSRLDVYGDGQITNREFVAGSRGGDVEDRAGPGLALSEIFRSLDANGDGRLTEEEYRADMEQEVARAEEARKPKNLRQMRRQMAQISKFVLAETGESTEAAEAKEDLPSPSVDAANETRAGTGEPNTTAGSNSAAPLPKGSSVSNQSVGLNSSAAAAAPAVKQIAAKTGSAQVLVTMKENGTENQTRADINEYVAEVVLEGKPLDTAIGASFNKLDAFGDGNVTRSEFAAIAKSNSTEDPDASSMISDVFGSLDANNDGSLSRTEYTKDVLGAVPHHHLRKLHGPRHYNQKAVDRSFGRLDRDQDGVIGLQEFKQNAEAKPGKSALAGLFKLLDADGDWKLSLQEYRSDIQRVVPAAQEPTSQAPPADPLAPPVLKGLASPVIVPEVREFHSVVPNVLANRSPQDSPPAAQTPSPEPAPSPAPAMPDEIMASAMAAAKAVLMKDSAEPQSAKQGTTKHKQKKELQTSSNAMSSTPSSVQMQPAPTTEQMQQLAAPAPQSSATVNQTMIDPAQTRQLQVQHEKTALELSFERLDDDMDGGINKVQFTARARASEAVEGSGAVQFLSELFETLDTDNDGVVTLAEYIKDLSESEPQLIEAGDAAAVHTDATILSTSTLGSNKTSNRTTNVSSIERQRSLSGGSIGGNSSSMVNNGSSGNVTGINNNSSSRSNSDSSTMTVSSPLTGAATVAMGSV